MRDDCPKVLYFIAAGVAGLWADSAFSFVGEVSKLHPIYGILDVIWGVVMLGMAVYFLWKWGSLK